MSDRTDIEVTGLSSKLVAFSASLTPGEARVFNGLMSAARDNIQGDNQVGGYDAGDQNQGLTKLFDNLGIAPLGNVNPGVADRLVDTHN